MGMEHIKRKMQIWWIMVLILCCTLHVDARELKQQVQEVNIVAVVDCSTSMQSSDPDWKVPDSLRMFVDACPAGEDVRLSLILYGTNVNTVFQDMPLTDENKEYITGLIRYAIQSGGYSYGQTDTGAALQEAKKIFENHLNQKNFVILFTDGDITATHNGRSAELSRKEVDEFAAYAQDNKIRVDTYALFADSTPDEIIEQSKEELGILKRKTGGVYRTINDLGILPEIILELLKRILDVRVFGIEGEEKEFSFFIDSERVNDITMLIPSSEDKIEGVFLTDERGKMYEIVQRGKSGMEEVDVFPEAEYITGMKYNGKPGYTVVHMANDMVPSWMGKWKITFQTEGSIPEISAFYRYDVELHVTVQEEWNVMDYADIQIYLTNANGVRIYDGDFLDSLQVSMQIVNLQSMSQEYEAVRQNGKPKAVEGSGESSVDWQDGALVFQFLPRRATEYVIIAEVENEKFMRTIETEAVFAADGLCVSGSYSPEKIDKNSMLAIRAYLYQGKNQEKIEGQEYYEKCKATAEIVNVTENTVRTIPLFSRVDGSGVEGKYKITEAGEYEVRVHTNSDYEMVDRVSEPMNFAVKDRPVQAIKTEKTIWTLGGRHVAIDLRGFFTDPDGDVFWTGEPVVVNGKKAEVTMDDSNILYFTGGRSGKYEVEIKAFDYSGNSAAVVLEVMNMSWIMLGGIVILLIAVVAVIVILIRWKVSSSNLLKGIVWMEVSFNEERKNDANGRFYLSMGRFPIALKDPLNVEEEEAFGDRISGWKEIWSGKQYSINKLLYRYMRMYQNAGFADDGAADVMCGKYNYMRSDEIRNMAKLYGRKHGNRMLVKPGHCGKKIKVFNQATKRKNGYAACGETIEIRMPVSPERADTVSRTIQGEKGRRDVKIPDFWAESICVRLTYYPKGTKEGKRRR